MGQRRRCQCFRFWRIAAAIFAIYSYPFKMVARVYVYLYSHTSHFPLSLHGIYLFAVKIYTHTHTHTCEYCNNFTLVALFYADHFAFVNFLLAVSCFILHFSPFHDSGFS